MSAIFVVWERGGRLARDNGERLLRALRPHGTQHESLSSDGPIALGRLLYNTLPEDVYDRQPIAAGGGRYLIAADIRIDNRAELAGMLDLPREAVAATADSALFALAWERWTTACLDRIIGDFAFLVWDRSERRLFAARDHVGQRPLVYFANGKLLAIASMPKGLLALPDVPNAVDEERLASQLAREPLEDDEVFDTRTFHKHIHRVPPGHILTATETGETLRRYWTIEPRPTLRFTRDDDYVERATEILGAAVQARLRRVGPAASHLSSGLDSTAVTVTAADLLAAEGARLLAYTAVPHDGDRAVAPRGRNPHEGPLAAAVAKRLPNVDHVLVPYPLRSPVEPLAPMTFASDMPTPNPCNLQWLDRIHMDARDRRVRVMLDGVMGNSTLSYEGSERLPILLWHGKWGEWLREAAAAASARGASRWRIFRSELLTALPSARRYVAAHSSEHSLSRHSPLAPSVAQMFSGMRRISRAMFALGDRHAPSALYARRLALQVGRMDPGLRTAGDLARYGIDVRSPTSDKRLIEFCLALPLDQFHRDGQPRRLVKRMMRDRLPHEVLAQRRRGYQGAGWLASLRLAQDEVRETIGAMRQSTAGRALLDIDRLEQLARTIPREGEDKPQIIAAYRNVLLRGLSAAQFIRQVERGNG